ncbi:MAG: DUF4139 domain-containing protein [Gammaproteobacteria bacterium]|nr:DUF4139 domain-containing protein [Gammaproteobacteria bacterium]
MNIRLLLLLLLATIPLETMARIKLITLPVRERVEIQLDNAQATLVEEERIVPLIKGVNQVDFSWANTRIDSDSILFRMLPAQSGSQVDAKVLSVSYPPNENALVWSVGADRSGSARVRISYLLGGLDKSFHYRAVATKDESSLRLAQYLRLKNNSNESYAQSQLWVGFGDQLQRPVGLNETKDLLLKRYDQVQVQKRYTVDVNEYGYIQAAKKKLKVPMHYVLKNDAAHGLGQVALPFGKARIFQQDGKGGTTFVGEDWGRFTPRDDEMELYLGVARDIVVKRTIERRERNKISGNLYDYDVVVKYEVENFKEKPVMLDIREQLPKLRAELGLTNRRDVQWKLGRDTTLPAGPDPEKSDADRLLFHVDLAPQNSSSKVQKQVYKLHLVLQNEWR